MEKLSSVQSLRGLAALLVVLFHTELILGNSGIWSFGKIGVDIFFMVSGFIMFHIRYRYRNHNKTRATEFLWKRILRVAPPYWVYTLIILALFAVAPSLLQGEQPSLLHSILVIPDDKPFYLMVGWTISYELYFYLLFAVSLIIFRESEILQLIALGVYFILWILAGLFFSAGGPIWNFLTSLLHLEFLFGAAARIALGRLSGRRGMGLTLLIVGIALYLWAALSSNDTSRLNEMNFVLFLITAACLFLGMLLIQGRIANLIKRPLSMLGNSSYSLYLSHWLVLNAVALVLRKLGIFNAPAFLLIGCSVSFVWAMLTYRLVEHWLPHRIERMFARHRAIATVQNAPES